MSTALARLTTAADYREFLASKLPIVPERGIDVATEDLSDALFPWQKAAVRWALAKGRAALFEGCGLGKTRQQLEWSRQLLVQGAVERVLIVCPLNVSRQTIGEAADALDLHVHDLRADLTPYDGVNIVNYERVEKIDPALYGAVVLDESSILKAFRGATRDAIIHAFDGIRYKLACTATPAPNDHVELQSHAIFLDAPGANEMRARWFTVDYDAGVGDQKYRLKRHAAEDFWRWVCGWALSVEKPSDLGTYDDAAYVLPPLEVVDEVVHVDETKDADGTLFRMERSSATSMHAELRLTAPDRAKRAADLVAEHSEPWVLWVHTDYEADALLATIPEAEHLSGKDSDDAKLRKLEAFESGALRVLIAKPRMCGFGLNWQHCRRMAFVGLSYSWEQMYQAIRRCWRFGQDRPVTAHLVFATTESQVRSALDRKREDHHTMLGQMIGAVRAAQQETLGGRPVIEARDYATGDGWTLRHGDTVELMDRIEDGTVDLTVTSPPFSNLYVYSDALADMGNSADDGEFLAHYRYLAEKMLRKTRPGRMAVIHCMDMPRFKQSHGRTGIYDFPGDLVRVMESVGWQFHSRVTIWKCPKAQMERTKSHGLLHVQLCKDSTRSRQGLSDYLLVFRKWDEETAEIPVNGGDRQYRFNIGEYAGSEPPSPSEYQNEKDPARSYSIQVWRKYASPVWFDIDESDVLDGKLGREEKDERHICPLQVQVIARAVHLWSNPGDLVLDPFNGIGSTGYVALDLGRRYLGHELKASYLMQAQRNLESVGDGGQMSLLEAFG